MQLEKIAHEAQEAGWSTTVNYDKEKVTFTVDIPYARQISVPSLNGLTIVDRVDEAACLFTPTSRVAELLDEDPSLSGLVSTTALYEFAEAYKTKLKNLAKSLQMLKKSAYF